jgi:hypothetical protein
VKPGGVREALSPFPDFAPLNPGYGAAGYVLTFVIAGLDPAIHTAKRLKQNSEWLAQRHVSMDHRVKPGGDEGYCLSFSPRAGRR